MGYFEEFKHTKHKPTGRSLILHRQRIQLGLSMEEYALMAFIETRKAKNLPVSYDKIEKYLGIDPIHAKELLIMLKQKELIRNEKGIVITDKWFSVFEISEKEFEDFWNINSKPCWPGSRKESLKMYIKARKLFDKDFLLQQRNAYFKFLQEPENEYRSKMSCSTFLNPENEKFNQNWTKEVTTSEQKAEKINKEKMFS